MDLLVDEVLPDEERVVVEENKVWKKQVPHLYDTIISHALEWPSLTAQWLPANFTPSQPIHPSLSSHSASHLLLGTHASDNEPNFLLVAHVNAPVSFSSSSSASFKNAVHVMQKIYVNSEVNRARHCPQRPSLVACQTGGADFLLFDLAKHPSKPVRDSVCIPDARLVGHKKQGYGISWSQHQEGLIASGADDKVVGVFDINNSSSSSSSSSNEASIEPLMLLSGHQDVVEDVACSPHSAHEIVSCSDDGTIRFWDVRQSGQQSQTLVLNAHQAEVNAITYSPFYDTLLASASADRTVAIWDRRVMGGSGNKKNRQARALATLEGGHSEQVFNVAWSPHCATHLVSGAADRRMCVWDLSRLGGTDVSAAASKSPPELMFIHGGHSEKIHDFSWHPTDKNLIASVADNSLVQIWKMNADFLDA